MTAPDPAAIAKGCSHRITQGREGHRPGESWCVDCGVKVMAVHDRPCGECKHHFRLTGYSGCRRHLMAVTPDMHVTYYLVDGPGRSGLCFEENSHD